MDVETTTINDPRRYLGISDLSVKERRILSMLVLGYTIADMATDLCISRNYVYLILRQLRARFLAKTNTAVVVRALSLGLISADGHFKK